MSLNDVLAEVQSSYVFQKEIELKEVTYVLQVLDNESERKVNAAVNTADLTEDVDAYIKELRKELLSRAIVSIKGQDIPEVVEVNDEKIDRPLYLKSFLDKIPGSILIKMFEAYVDLREESEEAISKTMRYDWFKTPEQREQEMELEQKKREQKDREEKTDNETEPLSEDIDDVNLRPINETKEPEIPLTNDAPKK